MDEVSSQLHTICVRIVTFIVKKIDRIIFFACFKGKLNSSHVEIEKKIGTIFKKLLKLMVGLA